MHPEPAVLEPGAVLVPGFEVAGLLRRGLDLDAYEVWSLERACSCVVKTPRPDRASDVAVRRRLRAEGRRLLSLTHPSLARAYELVDRPRLALVLETLQGETVAHLVERCRLGCADLAELGLQLCAALGYLHGRGVLHLDVKPSNVICDRGVARLVDLSVARPVGRCPAGWGTGRYLSPEQARGGRVTAASDVWGLGGLLFEAATGIRASDTVHGAEPRAASVRSLRRLPAVLAGAIDACLDPAPAERPTLPELWRVLDDMA
jgi:serine/threonine protein kinase